MRRSRAKRRQWKWCWSIRVVQGEIDVERDGHRAELPDTSCVVDEHGAVIPCGVVRAIDGRCPPADVLQCGRGDARVCADMATRTPPLASFLAYICIALTHGKLCIGSRRKAADGRRGSCVELACAVHLEGPVHIVASVATATTASSTSEEWLDDGHVCCPVCEPCDTLGRTPSAASSCQHTMKGFTRRKPYRG